MDRLTTRNYIDKQFEGYCFNGINTVKDYKEAYNSGYLTIVLSRAEEKLGQLEDFLEEHDCETLSDYTKQVRKEVVQEIWEEFEQRLMNKTEDMPVMKVANMINSVLDQILGEENERNIKTN